MKLFLKADSVGHSGGFLHAGSVNDRHSYLEQLFDMCGMRTWFTQMFVYGIPCGNICWQTS